MFTALFSVILFWYQEALIVFLRVWKNSILFLEEDLAVSLMLNLLFIPLYPNIESRVLTFTFRFLKIILGLITYFLLTVVLLVAAFYWFSLPVLAFILTGLLGIISKILLFSGLVLFINHIFTHPLKKVWQVKNSKEIWRCSTINISKIHFPVLLRNEKARELMEYLELGLPDIPLLNQSSLQSLSEEALNLGKRLKVKYLDPEHFFASLLFTQNFKRDDLFDGLFLLKKRQDLWRMIWIWDDDFENIYLKSVDKKFLGRVNEFTTLVNALSLKSDINVVIVGEDGSGKDALVDYLASKIALGEVSDNLLSKIVVRLDSRKAGEEIFRQNPNRIFAIDIKDYLKYLPFLKSPDLQFITTMAPSFYEQVLKRDSEFASLFFRVDLPPASEEETMEILIEKEIEMERRDKIKVTIPALRKIIELGQRDKSEVLPGNAIKLLDLCKKEIKGNWIKKQDMETIAERS